MNKMFKCGEQEVLDKLPKAINNLKEEIGLENKEKPEVDNSQNSNRSNSMQRVLTLPGIVVPKDNVIEEPKQDNDFSRFFTNSSNSSLDNKASSFIIIVSAVLILIILVTLVTLGILKYLGY